MCAGAKPDRSRIDGKKQFRIVQDPQYRRFGSSVDLNLALDLFVPNGSVGYKVCWFCAGLEVPLKVGCAFTASKAFDSTKRGKDGLLIFQNHPNVIE